MFCSTAAGLRETRVLIKITKIHFPLKSSCRSHFPLISHSQFTLK